MSTVAPVAVLAVAPHPDDETLGCGGALALHAERGDHVTVVWLTAGERGIPGLGAKAAAQTRRREARAAIAELRVREGVFLDLPDGGIRDHSRRAVDGLSALLAELAPSIVYTPHPDEVHPDHAATTTVTVQAMRRHGGCETLLFGYEIWSPVPWPHHTEDVGNVFDRKLAAIECHRSQTAQLPYAQLASGLAGFRGAMTLGCARAESFVDIPWKEDLWPDPA